MYEAKVSGHRAEYISDQLEKLNTGKSRPRPTDDDTMVDGPSWGMGPKIWSSLANAALQSKGGPLEVELLKVESSKGGMLKLGCERARVSESLLN